MDLFNLYNADNHKYAIVVSIPHSGTEVPSNIRRAMLPDVVLSNTDWFLKELYSFLPRMGVTVLSSNMSRYVIDLNRDMEADVNGTDFWTKLVHSHNTFGKPLYVGAVQPDEVEERINKYFKPYHTALEQVIESKLQVFDKVLLLDLHSFYADFVEGADEDISLSNYNYKTSTPESMEALNSALTEQGYTVGINIINGRYILKRYKQLFGDKIDCIQVELRYPQYIEKRYFGEEELSNWNKSLFASAQKKLRAALTKLLINWG